MKVLDQAFGDDWAMYHGDCVEVTKGLPDESIHYTIFSPPFSSLYTYSDSERDMGNSKGDSEFNEHFNFLAKELFRITKPGRLVSIHCMDIPAMKERDGYIGLKDFPADLRSMMQEAGFIYHGKNVIWKDPLIEATRTKAIGLMHKQIEKDSSMCRPGLPDYIVTMRKPGENQDRISHPGGLKVFYGVDEPRQRGIEYSHNVWRRYASPIWMDINQTRTLNVVMARDERDERHICPLQLDTIARCLELWSNENDVVFSPFAGIGSEGYESIKMGRKFIGVELKRSYFVEAVKNLEMATNRQEQVKLFA
jgi:DNA modification methylase